MDESMIDAELDAALDKAYTSLLVSFDNPGFVRIFNDHIALGIKHKALENHWWTKLGKFLHVL